VQYSMGATSNNASGNRTLCRFMDGRVFENRARCTDAGAVGPASP
jgi:hypothetical protein